MWKYKYRLGLETLVVYTVKNEFIKIYVYFSWVVQSQDWNLTELAGICFNGGICGLIR